MKYIVLALISFSLAACFSSKVATDTVSEPTLNLDKAKAKFPGYSTAMFDSGKKLYDSNCQSCHALKDPLKFTEEQWTKLVPSMSAKANKNKGANLSKEDEDLIFKYLVSVGL
ncbi:MAG: cytochrome c [Bacteroidia bacterium]|nr:cytochrome c [Bacteroidia bacterium]NNJ55632.1 cytochrome c [Bacteroidia bacterium]